MKAGLMNLLSLGLHQLLAFLSMDGDMLATVGLGGLSCNASEATYQYEGVVCMMSSISAGATEELILSAGDSS